ncbi:hypothetical protein, partial [Staphylococcus aureus]|uniref:hypothetical protein n=1 Tax=Staphylococcus aureus TaxID=1280 RepID=UPI0021D3BA26
MDQVVIEGISPPYSPSRSLFEESQGTLKTSNGKPKQSTKPQILFRAPNFAGADEMEGEKASVSI